MTELHCMDGISNQLANLLPALGKLGWEPHLVVGLIDVSPATEPTLARIREACGSFTHTPELYGAGRMTPRRLRRQWRILGAARRRTGCDVIHLRGRALAPAATIDRRLGGVPFVNVPPLALRPDNRSWAGRTLRRVTGRALGDRVIAISVEMIEHLHRQWGVPRRRIRHVPHGINLQRFQPASPDQRRGFRERLDLPPAAFVCCQIGRVGSIKRPDTLVRAVARLAGAGQPVIALLAGQAGQSQRVWIESLAAELGVVDRIRLIGHGDPVAVLGASDAKVLCSEREGFGIAVIEAMACGVVPVRTPTEGAADQIEPGQTGLLFPVGDDAALARHLRWLIDHPDDRRRIGQACVEAAHDKFSDVAMARGTAAVYEELLDGPS